MVEDLVVVRVSKTNAASESFEDRGVEEKDRKDVRRCDRTVVFPDPDSPKKTTAWSSPLLPNLVHALRARSSVSATALPSLFPLTPLEAEVYVFRQIKACDESFAVGNDTWKRLARCAVS